MMMRRSSFNGFLGYVFILLMKLELFWKLPYSGKKNIHIRWGDYLHRRRHDLAAENTAIVLLIIIILNNILRNDFNIVVLVLLMFYSLRENYDRFSHLRLMEIYGFYFWSLKGNAFIQVNFFNIFDSEIFISFWW